MASREEIYCIIIGVIVFFGIVTVVLSCRIEKLRLHLDLMEETLKQWQTTFNELRGTCDILAKGIDATNERVDWLVKCNEDNLPAIEAMKEREAKHGEKT